MNRIMIAGTNSGCGKTTVTCAVLQAFVNRGKMVTAFKCGPDYIDPMFHNRITGITSRNLDRFFCDENTVKYLLDSVLCDIAVIEGVMGFYDGAGENASSCVVSNDTDTPVIIVIDCKGMSLSVGAIMNGFLSFRKNNIAGFIFNRLPESLVPQTKRLCSEIGTEYLGRFPKCSDAVIESRHLGLVTADEITDLKHKMNCLAEYAEKYLCLDRIAELSKTAKPLSYTAPVIKKTTDKPLPIAAARDNAFCFYYEENFELLRKMGCEIIPFSPLHDKKLPDEICGLWLGGGYPELYAEELSKNTAMRSNIFTAVKAGLPTIAECGGFMYLGSSISDKSGITYDMAGVLDCRAFFADKLVRFGYADITAQEDNLLCQKGNRLKAHEFHYWDSTDCGNGFTARKINGTEYPCVHTDSTLYAGFPHLYLYANQKAAERFITKCTEYRSVYEKNR